MKYGEFLEEQVPAMAPLQGLLGHPNRFLAQNRCFCQSF